MEKFSALSKKGGTKSTLSILPTLLFSSTRTWHSQMMMLDFLIGKFLPYYFSDRKVIDALCF
ncbi:MAG: hypothetical protein AYK18_03705 [Theionarchaea archaeon DG-70]|nr:MAG: hypothetical protein AYK18_03705 [Theionarchaea archaeon DG-70]